MSNIDAAALAQARERLEAMAQYTLANTKRQPESVQVERADLRLVLDALKEARTQAFEEAAREVCMWCGSRALVDGKPSPKISGPNEAGNYTHQSHGAPVLCAASSFHSLIHWEGLSHA